MVAASPAFYRRCPGGAEPLGSPSAPWAASASAAAPHTGSGQPLWAKAAQPPPGLELGHQNHYTALNITAVEFDFYIRSNKKKKHTGLISLTFQFPVFYLLLDECPSFFSAHVTPQFSECSRL